MQHPLAAARRSPVTRSEIIAAMVEVECPSLFLALFIRHSVKMAFVLLARPRHYVSNFFTVFAFFIFLFYNLHLTHGVLLCVTHYVVRPWWFTDD